MLPAEAYISADVLAWERRNLFAGSWMCVGRLDELSGVSARALEVGDVGVLLTFDPLRALANVCRHRGHELLPVGGASERSRLVCPYHGWGYRLDGSLRSATGMEPVPTSDATTASSSCRPVRGRAGSSSTRPAPRRRSTGYIGAMADLLAPYRCDSCGSAPVTTTRSRRTGR